MRRVFMLFACLALMCGALGCGHYSTHGVCDCDAPPGTVAHPHDGGCCGH